MSHISDMINSTRKNLGQLREKGTLTQINKVFGKSKVRAQSYQKLNEEEREKLQKKLQQDSKIERRELLLKAAISAVLGIVICLLLWKGFEYLFWL